MRTAVLLTLALAGPLPALAEAPARADYVVRWGGFDVGALQTELQVADDRYRVAWTGQTTGFLATLFPFSSYGAAEGSRSADGLVAERFAGESVRRDERTPFSVRFPADGGQPEVELPQEERDERDPVPPALQRHPDPLTLALDALLEVAPGTRASGTSFDGRRAVRSALVCAEAPQAAASGASVQPDALSCSLTGEVIAGMHRRWRDSADRARREPVRLRLERGVVTDLWWPVRIDVPTRWGPVIVELVRKLG